MEWLSQCCLTGLKLRPNERDRERKSLNESTQHMCVCICVYVLVCTPCAHAFCVRDSDSHVVHYNDKISKCACTHTTLWEFVGLYNVFGSCLCMCIYSHTSHTSLHFCVFSRLHVFVRQYSHE